MKAKLSSATAVALAHIAMAGTASAAPPPPPSEYLEHDSDGFFVAYHPGTRERVRGLLPQLTQIREELRSAVGTEVLTEVHIRVVALPLELGRVAPDAPPLEAGGAVMANESLVIVSGDGSPGREGLERSLRHQLAHLALVEATGGAEVPAWFEEGFAIQFAREDRVARLQSIELAVLTGAPPSLASLGESAAPDQRAFAADFARFAALEPERVPALLSGLRGGLPFDRALESAFGERAGSIDRSWREDLSRRYAFFPVALLGLFMWLAVAVIGRLRRRRAVAAAGERASVRPRRLRARTLRPREVTAIEVGAPARREGPTVPKVEHDGDWHTLH